MLTTSVISGSIFRSFYRAEWCRLKVKNGSYAPAEPVLHIEHPPHILGRIDNSEDEDDISNAESVYTALGGGVVTEERLLDASLGRPKRRLVPIVNIRVTRRSKEGSARDIVRDQDANDHDDEVNDIDADEDIGEVDFVQPLPISGPASESDLDPALDLDLDLGEANEFDDPIQGEEAFAPVLGPRPEDILFDLSDSSLHDGETNGGTGTQTPASEAEVWAELEDGEMNQARTPAGMLGDYEMSEDGSEHDHGQVGTVQVGGEEDGVPDGVIDLGFTDAETVDMREELVQSSRGDDAQGSEEPSSEDDGGDVFEETMEEATGPLPGDNIDIDSITVDVDVEEAVDIGPSEPLVSAVSQGDEGQDGSDVALDDADVEIPDPEAKSHDESVATVTVVNLDETIVDDGTVQPEAQISFLPSKTVPTP